MESYLKHKEVSSNLFLYGTIRGELFILRIKRRIANKALIRLLKLLSNLQLCLFFLRAKGKLNKMCTVYQGRQMKENM